MLQLKEAQRLERAQRKAEMARQQEEWDREDQKWLEWRKFLSAAEDRVRHRIRRGAELNKVPIGLRPYFERHNLVLVHQ
jgi:hypothetical protein